MRKVSSIILGLVFILIGVLVGLNALGIANINLFFDGWWTLFIIIPCVIGLINDHDKTGSIIGIIVGVCLLLCCQNVLSFDLLWKLLLPIILVVIGLSILFKEMLMTKVRTKIDKLNKEKKSDDVNSAIFGGQNINYANEEFKGCDLEAVFGGIDLDLRDAIINEDVVINAKCVFGGIDIYVPKNVNVVVSSTSLFGGIDNELDKKFDEGKSTVYINAKCVFGGVGVNDRKPRND